MKPIIGITTGCLCGIGPEIVKKAVNDERVREMCEVKVFGNPEAGSRKQEARKNELGYHASSCGLASMHAVESAVSAVMAGEIQALVTAPINKSHWKTALARRRFSGGGCKFPGHTEYLAHLTGTSSVAMMMASPRLKVSLVTTHLPLAEVPRAITKERICEVVRLTCMSLRGALAPKQSPLHSDSHGIASSPTTCGEGLAMTARVAICALNPHASDHGTFGDEEERIIIPAINELQAEGLNVSGPCPADTVFWKAVQGEFDAVVAMYHDQALAPIKTLDFKHTVNITLGLPFVRTAPDHGTAEDIAGKGIADHENMVEAVRLAVKLTNDQ